MSDLFAVWRSRVEMISLRVVDAYAAELPGYRRIVADPRARTELLDLMVFARGRTVELATDGQQFTDDDLGTIAAGGRIHGAAGVSPAAQRRAVLIHTKLTLRELHEAAGSRDIDNLMRVLRWYAPQSRAVRAAYARGFLHGQQAHLPIADRVRVLTGLLLAGDAMAAELATSLAMTVPDRCVVLVARTPAALSGRADPPRTEIVTDLLARYRIPMSWEAREEFVALVGADGPVRAEDRALAVARDFAQLVELPCVAGAAVGDVSDLAGTLAQARQVCRVAPAGLQPGRVYYRTDLFAELGVARVPQVEAWLRDVAARLVTGPHLISTLAAFYRTDMSRTLTAAALGIHPRTLDYRLRRVHELTGLDPVSVRGVRILSTTVTRALAGAWT